MTPVDDPAEVIAVTMIEAAFAHLPAERAAGALAMADVGPIQRMVEAIACSAYAEGNLKGIARGRLDLEREMEEDWKPIAERAVRTAVRMPARAEIECRRNGCAGSEYMGGPVAAW